MAQTTINNGDTGATVRAALNTMFGELYAGGGIPAVDTFADLPAASSYTDKIYRVKTTTGAWYTFDKKSSGIYQSDGTIWVLQPGVMAMTDLIDISIATEPAEGTIIGYDDTNNVWKPVKSIAGQNDTIIPLTATNGGTCTLDFSASNSFKIDATALTVGQTTTVAASNLPADGKFEAVTLIVLTGAGIPVFSWPGSQVVAALQASKEHYYTLTVRDGSTVRTHVGEVF